MLHKSQGSLDATATGKGREMVSHHQHALHGLATFIAIDVGFFLPELMLSVIVSSNDRFRGLNRMRINGWLFRPLSNRLQAAHEFLVGKAHVLGSF